MEEQKNKKLIVTVLVLIAVIGGSALAYGALKDRMSASSFHAVDDTTAVGQSGEVVEDGRSDASDSASAESSTANTDATSASTSADSGSTASANSDSTSTSSSEATPTTPTIRDFEIESLDGATITLSDLKGKPTILGFWATWCPPCNSEAPDVQMLFDEYQDKVNFVMVTYIDNYRETESGVAEWQETNGYSYPIYLDKTGECHKNKLTRYIPETFILDENGEIKATGSTISFDEVSDILNDLL